jgi:predicted ATPase
VRPDFGLRDLETAAAVTEICESLDGLPLGIELAAARMAAMSAPDVRDRLADRFRLLQGTDLGPERHLTLRNTVAWSYDLLAADERELLRSMSVYQLVADGLPMDFPVLRSIDDFPGDLPRQLTSLVGREPVVTDIAELVRSNPLVTLTGLGGVGKSRLAVEVGAEVAGELPDGVWIVELASVGEPASVPAAIATALGITPQGDVPLLDTIADALGGRQMLLLVDNCEHVVSAVASVLRAILALHGDVKILATSREVLGLDDEVPFTVSPLALEGGEMSDAVALFVDRARAVRPDFGLRDPETAAAVTEICETLDGLPRGIELAAARMAAMSATEVRDRLTDEILFGSLENGGTVTIDESGGDLQFAFDEKRS